MKDIPMCDVYFIRSQSPQSIPLLAELFGLPLAVVSRIQAIRAGRGERMPLRLLKQLVQQRRERLRAENYVTRDASDLAGGG